MDIPEETLHVETEDGTIHHIQELPADEGVIDFGSKIIRYWLTTSDGKVSWCREP